MTDANRQAFIAWLHRQPHSMDFDAEDRTMLQACWEAAQAAQREQDRRALESAQRTLLTLQGMPELGRLREGLAAPLREIAAAIRNQEQS